MESGLWVWLRFGSVTGLLEPAPSPKPRQNPKSSLRVATVFLQTLQPKRYGRKEGMGRRKILSVDGSNLFEVVILLERFSKVARSSQPWALGRNPFGILNRGDWKQLWRQAGCLSYVEMANFSHSVIFGMHCFCQSACRLPGILSSY